MIQQLESGAADVSVEHAFGLVCVVSAERGDEELVFVVHGAIAIRAEQQRECASIVLGRIPEPLHGRAEDRRRRCAVRQQMELPVEMQERLEIRASLHLVGELAESIENFGGEPRHAVAQHERFDALADLVDLLAFVEAQVCDPRAGVGDEGDQTIRFQDAQCFTHRQSTRAELLSDVLLPDARARRVRAVKDGLAQRRRDAVASGTVTAGGGGHRGPICRRALSYSPGRAGFHSLTGASFSYALPSGKLTSSNCMPHGLRKYTQRWPVLWLELAVACDMISTPFSRR